MTFPFVCNVPIAVGLGSPSVSLRKALLALAAAFLRGTGCSLSVDLRFKVSLPAASIGAKCFSVVSLHANGREDSLAAKTWLICGSVHPPLFALSGCMPKKRTAKQKVSKAADRKGELQCLPKTNTHLNLKRP